MARGGRVVVLIVVAFFGITGATGLTGPAWMHRYQYSELGDLAAAINANAGDLRTADDCWRTTPSKDDAKRDPTGPLREIARTDYVRSRVVVRGYASQSGKIDANTTRAITDSLDNLFAEQSRVLVGDDRHRAVARRLVSAGLLQTRHPRLDNRLLGSRRQVVHTSLGHTEQFGHRGDSILGRRTTRSLVGQRQSDGFVVGHFQLRSAPQHQDVLAAGLDFGHSGHRPRPMCRATPPRAAW